MDRCIISKGEVVLGAPKLYKMKNEMKNNNTPPPSQPNQILHYKVSSTSHVSFSIYLYDIV